LSGSSDASQQFPARGRLLGLDYGTKRVGLALSNPEQTIASPLETYQRRDERQDALYLARMAREYSIAGLVVGLPVHMSGDEGGKARDARTFGQWAAKATGLPVTWCDERYTSALADEHLRAAQLGPKQRKARRDMLAAQIMLQTFLDSARREEPPATLH
jgi:putative Holliday junction resolvase